MAEGRQTWLSAGATGRLLGERHIAAPAERYSAKAILGAARGTLAAPAHGFNAQEGIPVPWSRPISARLLFRRPVALLGWVTLARGREALRGRVIGAQGSRLL